MNYPDFFETVNKIIQELPYDLNAQVENDTLRWSEMRAGAAGGNCWGDEAEGFVAEMSEAFASNAALAAVCEATCPELPFLKWNRMQRELVEKTTDTNCEYYGNYTEYDVRSIDLRALRDFLFDGK